MRCTCVEERTATQALSYKTPQFYLPRLEASFSSLLAYRNLPQFHTLIFSFLFSSSLLSQILLCGSQLEQASRVVYSSKHNSSIKPSVRPRTQVQLEFLSVINSPFRHSNTCLLLVMWQTNESTASLIHSAQTSRLWSLAIPLLLCSTCKWWTLGASASGNYSGVFQLKTKVTLAHSCLFSSSRSDHHFCATGPAASLYVLLWRCLWLLLWLSNRTPLWPQNTGTYTARTNQPLLLPKLVSVNIQ